MTTVAQIDQGQTVEYLRAYLHEHFGVPFVGSVIAIPLFFGKLRNIYWLLFAGD